MNNKITLPELVDLVAQATNSSKRVSELFLKELFATITQTLADGDSVKVKGLGTFKLTEVSPRKSVNVNTGEAIEIPGHNKLTFIADKELADAVNTPFAQFDTVVLDDGVTDEALRAIDNGGPVPDEVICSVAGEPEDSEAAGDAEEADGLQADDQAEAADVPDADSAASGATVTPPPFSLVDVESSSDEAVPEQSAESVVSPPPFVPVLPDENPVDDAVSSDACSVAEAESGTEAAELAAPDGDTSTTAVADDDADSAEEPEQKAEIETEDLQKADNVSQPETQPLHDEKSVGGLAASRLDYEEYITDDEIVALEKKATLKGFLWGVLVGIILCAVAGYLWTMAVPDKKVEQAEVLGDTVAADSVKSVDAAVAKTDTVKASQATKAAPEPKPQAEPAVVYETVTPSNVPARMARKHYGKECFWVYIYEENKGKIKNPNNIKEGTRLVIPPKEKYGIDMKNEQSVKKAQRLLYDLQKQAENKEK